MMAEMKDDGGREFRPPPSIRGCYPEPVSHPTENEAPSMPPGLCQDCIHARRIESDRGSVFILCQLALTDPRFKKYPRLPVLSCPGYERQTAPVT
jgi:hypothetical protein